MLAPDPWYRIDNESEIDSPSLLVYPDRIAHNLSQALKIAEGPERFRPHVKTHKMPQIIQMQLEAGITKFKCATIAEAEMLVGAGAKDILLAYQPTGPKIARLKLLVEKNPDVKFAALVDNLATLEQIASTFADADSLLRLYIDLDVGMHRTGIAPGTEALTLYRHIHQSGGVEVGGLHVYDGHFRDPDFGLRKQQSDEAFVQVDKFRQQLLQEGLAVPTVVAGGSPTFPVHALRQGIELSPGTFVFWDAGYADILPDLPFQFAAVLLTRVISKPAEDILCLDLGHKAVASEKPHPRVQFLNLNVTEFTGHSEEHLVLRSPQAHELQVGDCVYAVPMHICPTVALHQHGFML